MRVMLTAKMDCEAANRAIKDGSLPKIMGALFEAIKPESVYFGTHEGQRTAFIVFDMKDSSMLPTVAEPLFMGLGASLSVQPVMNQDELKKGLEAAAKRF